MKIKTLSLSLKKGSIETILIKCFDGINEFDSVWVIYMRRCTWNILTDFDYRSQKKKAQRTAQVISNFDRQMFHHKLHGHEISIQLIKPLYLFRGKFQISQQLIKNSFLLECTISAFLTISVSAINRIRHSSRFSLNTKFISLLLK